MTIPENIKLISLSQGKFVIVDAEDYDFLMQWNWHLTYDKDRKWLYAYRNKHSSKNKKCARGRMHRIILNAQNGVVVDHINGNGLDNRRCNLRICSFSQNLMNQNKTRGSSKYKGVTWDKNRNLWKAAIRLKRKTIHLGRFKFQRDAAFAYNNAAILYFGDFAKLNIIRY